MSSLPGGLAQLAERVLSMHEVSGSIPEFSTFDHSFLLLFIFHFALVRLLSVRYIIMLAIFYTIVMYIMSPKLT